MATRSLHRAHRGQVLVLLAVGSVILIGFLALAIDVGYLLSQRRGVQNAADAGALAVAVAMLKGEQNAAVLTSTAAYYAEQNGYAVTPTVTPDFPGKKVTVELTYDVPKFFLGVVYSGRWQTRASAVASVEPEPIDAAILALNPNGSGIVTSGNTVINVTGGSVMSNSRISTSGYTKIQSTHWVNAHKGFNETGNSNLIGGHGTDQSAPMIPDPFDGKLSPPVMPAFPGNPVPTVNPPPQATCPTGGTQVPVGTYTANCAAPWYPLLPSFEFRGDQYRFLNGSKIELQASRTVLGNGTFNFVGNNGGISANGSVPGFAMEGGQYSFLNGARINLNGTVVDPVVGGTFYFSGGGGFTVGSNINLTLTPGTYIFDGGSGFTIGGGGDLNFAPGEYTFYFRGSGLHFSGNTRITAGNNVYVRMYFLDGSQLTMNGSTRFDLPSGEYYFDRSGPGRDCKMTINGNTVVAGDNVFFYFGKDCNLTTTGSASYGFTAPTTEIYPGYHPGIFMYAHPANTKQFQWNGSTQAQSVGVIYLPSATLKMSGASTGKVFKGQMIAGQFELGGGNSTELEYEQYVEIDLPAVYLIQ